MVPEKELHYFTYLDDKEHKYYLTEKQYIKQFQHGDGFKAVGEASPSYLYSIEAPKRIREFNPQMRLIAVLRNPVDRAYSNFLHNLRRGTEPVNDFTKAIQLEGERIKEGWDFSYHYVSKGYYGEQLRRYYDVFDKAQLKVILLNDLRKNPAETIRQLFDFLKVDDNFLPDLSARHNTSGIAKNKVIGQWLNVLQRSSKINRIIKVLIPYKLREKLKKSFYTQLPMTDAARKTLDAIFQEDVIQLQTLINRDLSDWLIEKP